MTRNDAYELVNIWTKNRNLVKHMLAAEAIMCALSRYFHEDEEVYRIVGLLHDMDYEKMKDTPEKHPFTAVSELERLKVNPIIIRGVLVHAWGWRTEIPEPKSNMEWSIYCCDELSGLITACALVRPDKKLESVTVESIMKKFTQKSFAAGAKRENIIYCESKLGIKLADFINISLKAMQDIHQDLGL
jgi:uncharacterized protein